LNEAGDLLVSDEIRIEADIQMSAVEAWLYKRTKENVFNRKGFPNVWKPFSFKGI
jgi:hypothetical protein